jgi:hypothetical protein
MAGFLFFILKSESSFLGFELEPSPAFLLQPSKTECGKNMVPHPAMG